MRFIRLFASISAHNHDDNDCADSARFPSRSTRRGFRNKAIIWNRDHRWIDHLRDLDPLYGPGHLHRHGPGRPLVSTVPPWSEAYRHSDKSNAGQALPVKTSNERHRALRPRGRLECVREMLAIPSETENGRVRWKRVSRCVCF